MQLRSFESSYLFPQRKKKHYILLCGPPTREQTIQFLGSAIEVNINRSMENISPGK